MGPTVSKEFRATEDYRETTDHRVRQVHLVCLDHQENTVKTVLQAKMVTQEYVVHQDIRDLLGHQVCQECQLRKVTGVSPDRLELLENRGNLEKRVRMDQEALLVRLVCRVNVASRVSADKMVHLDQKACVVLMVLMVNLGFLVM